MIGTIYAAHALYHFIGPTIALIALGTASLAAMSAAALHGPALAGNWRRRRTGDPPFIESETHHA